MGRRQCGSPPPRPGHRRQPHRSLAGPAGRLCRADPDHGASGGQPGHRQGHRGHHPGTTTTPITTDQRDAPRPAQSRPRLPEPGIYPHLVSGSLSGVPTGSAFTNLQVTVMANNPSVCTEAPSAGRPPAASRLFLLRTSTATIGGNGVVRDHRDRLTLPAATTTSSHGVAMIDHLFCNKHRHDHP